MRLQLKSEAKLVYGSSVSLISFLSHEPLLVYHSDSDWWVLFGIEAECAPAPVPPTYGIDILQQDDGGYGMLMVWSDGEGLPAPPLGGFGYWAGIRNGGFRWTLQPCLAYRPHRQHRWVRVYPADLLDVLDRVIANASPAFPIQIGGLR